MDTTFRNLKIAISVRKCHVLYYDLDERAYKHITSEFT